MCFWVQPAVDRFFRSVGQTIDASIPRSRLAFCGIASPMYHPPIFPSSNWSQCPKGAKCVATGPEIYVPTQRPDPSSHCAQLASSSSINDSCSLTPSPHKQLGETWRGLLISRMLRAGAIHLKPTVDASFVIYAETWQPGDGVPRTQILQANDALALGVREYVLVI